MERRLTLHNLRRLVIRPGDVLVVSVPMKIRKEQSDSIKETISVAFPIDARPKIIVLEEGMKMASIRPAKKEADDK